MHRHLGYVAVLVLGAAFSLPFANSARAGTTYLFTVSCSDRRLVEEWDVGDIDSGKEHLRFVTGNDYPNCSVTDYDPATDAGLPRNTHSGAGAVGTGVINTVPIVGPLVCGLFGCGN